MFNWIKHTLKYRKLIIDWQQLHEISAPKQGALAPDFKLPEIEGDGYIRLSDYRDKKPVGLIFGSFT